MTIKVALTTEFVTLPRDAYLGGVDARTNRLAHLLGQRYGFEVHIIGSKVDASYPDQANVDSVTYHFVGKPREFVQRGDFFSRLRFNVQLYRKLSELNPDIIDASGFVSWLGSAKAAERIDAKSVATVHEVWQGEWLDNMGFLSGLIGRGMEGYLLKQDFDRYIAVSRSTKEDLIERIGVPSEVVDVVYNGVDLETFSNDLIGGERRDYSLITVSRLVHYKRIDWIIEAMGELRSDFPGLSLVVVGTGPEEDKLRRIAKELGVEDRTTFVGRIEADEDLAERISQCSCFVLASRVEGFGMVIPEAMAVGTPYVATDLPPIREITEGGTGGRLFPEDKRTALSDALRKELSRDVTPHERSQMREFVESRYEWETIEQKLAQIYRGLVGSVC